MNIHCRNYSLPCQISNTRKRNTSLVNNLFEMNMPWALILLTVGLVLLIKSADWLVDGSVSLADRFGISPIVIGLTIVAMGTSAPEAAASIVAALQNNGDVAIGNVYGSNIANLALIGGVVCNTSRNAYNAGFRFVALAHLFKFAY